jgi:ATP-dependent RNA helicase DDX49/DBP8
VGFMKKIFEDLNSASKKSSLDNDDEAPQANTNSSILVFVSTCRRCQEIHETLSQMNIDSVALHSMMTQNRRSASLGKFKSFSCPILIATDVASRCENLIFVISFRSVTCFVYNPFRGLDIPTVELVVNFDCPKVVSDYVHRVGRTARAGKSGRSVSFVTPSDVELVHAIEDFTGIKLEKANDIDENYIVPLLNPVAKAIRKAQLLLMEVGFDEKSSVHRKRRREQNEKISKKASSAISIDRP